MESESQLIWAMLFGAIGLGFFSYGRKQRAVVPLLTGIALFVFPYFVTDLYMLLLSGLALMAIPYFVKI